MAAVQPDLGRVRIAEPVQARIEAEVGDLLFAVVNLARKLDIDAETALKSGSRKFTRRFRYIEEQLAAQGISRVDGDIEPARQQLLQQPWWLLQFPIQCPFHANHPILSFAQAITA